MSSPDTTLVEARLAASAAAIAGDPATVYQLVSGLMDEGHPLESVLYDVLAPAQRDVGRRWQTGDYLVAEEHAATAAVETVLSLLAGALGRADGPHVVVAATQGDHHSVLSRMVATQLSFLGFRTTYLGANVLAADLRDFLEAEPPAALIVSCAMTTQLVAARRMVRAGHDAGVPVLVGGRGFGESGEWAELVGADAWVDDPRQIPEIIATWTPDAAAAEARAVDPSPVLIDLAAKRTGILASAERWLVDRSVPVDPEVGDQLGLLQGAVEAALLVGHDRPVTEMLAWQEATLKAQGGPDGSLIAEALLAALAGTSPAAEHVLAGAIH